MRGRDCPACDSQEGWTSLVFSSGLEEWPDLERQSQRRSSQKGEGRGKGSNGHLGLLIPLEVGLSQSDPCHRASTFLVTQLERYNLPLLPSVPPSSPSSSPLFSLFPPFYVFPSPLSVLQCPGASEHWGLAVSTVDFGFTTSALGSQSCLHLQVYVTCIKLFSLFKLSFPVCKMDRIPPSKTFQMRIKIVPHINFWPIQLLFGFLLWIKFPAQSNSLAPVSNLHSFHW